MYTIKCDDYFLHNVDAGLTVINGDCKLEINKTGLLTFYVSPTHPHRDKIKKLTSIITLYQDGEALFYGRVLNNEIDINNIMTVECEGELSFLLDTIQRAKEYHLDGGSDNVVKTFLETVEQSKTAEISVYTFKGQKFRVMQLAMFFNEALQSANAIITSNGY